MSLMDILTISSLVVGIASIVLAVFSMISANNSERRSQENFEKTQKMMNEIYDKTKDLLHEIDNKSSAISGMVEKNQTQLTTLFSNVLDKALPSQEKELATMSQEDIDKIIKENNTIDSNKLAMQLLPELIKNPDSLEKLVSISEKNEQKQIIYLYHYIFNKVIDFIRGVFFMQKNKKIVYLEDKFNNGKNIKDILIEYLIKKINNDQISF